MSDVVAWMVGHKESIYFGFLIALSGPFLRWGLGINRLDDRVRRIEDYVHRGERDRAIAQRVEDQAFKVRQQAADTVRYREWREAQQKVRQRESKA